MGLRCFGKRLSSLHAIGPCDARPSSLLHYFSLRVSCSAQESRLRLHQHSDSGSRNLITSAIFGVVYGVLLKPSPYRLPDRLCLLWESVPKKNIDRASYPTYQEWKRDARSFDDLAAFLRPDGSIVDLTGADNVEQVQLAKISANFSPT
jgi:hypothetical protein